MQSIQMIKKKTLPDFSLTFVKLTFYAEGLFFPKQFHAVCFGPGIERFDLLLVQPRF
jgi:hypothetical protein